MNPLNENNLTEQAYVECIQNHSVNKLKYSFTYYTLGAKLII